MMGPIEFRRAAGNETFEKLGTLGTSANLLVYLTQVFHMRSVDAATLLNGLNGTTSLAPIIGAFLSDAYLGRYLALAIASVASLIVSGALCCPSLACFAPRRRTRGGNSIVCMLG
jgi:dipeptide/tripeptide permease